MNHIHIQLNRNALLEIVLQKQNNISIFNCKSTRDLRQTKSKFQIQSTRYSDPDDLISYCLLNRLNNNTIRPHPSRHLARSALCFRYVRGVKFGLFKECPLCQNAYERWRESLFPNGCYKNTASWAHETDRLPQQFEQRSPFTFSYYSYFSCSLLSVLGEEEHD